MKEASWSDRWLQVILVGLVAYGVALVVVGDRVERWVFDPLGFGFADGGVVTPEAQSYVRFAYAVLGSVLVGWATTLLGLARTALARREPWAWQVVATAVIAWFLLDTGKDIVVGQLTHAAFNVVFLLLLAVPLLAIHRELVPRPAGPATTPGPPIGSDARPTCSCWVGSAERSHRPCPIPGHR